jgi:hypothetical protein
MQNEKPNDLTKHEYLHLGKLRSFAFVQLRHLIVALSEGSLPLGEGRVQKLVTQLVYHLGDVSANALEDDCFPWKADLYRGDFISVLKPVFANIVDRLCETPTQYEQTMIVSELSSFFSSWDNSGELRDVAGKLARALREWSTDLDCHVTDSTDVTVVNESKAKQCVYIRTAMLCLATGPISPQMDVRTLVDKGELIRHAVFLSERFLTRSLARYQFESA